METKRFLVSAAMAVLAASAIATPARQQVPERLDMVRLVQPAAKEKNHVLVVNVGGAIPDDSWGVVSTFAISRVQLNIWTNSVRRFDWPAYVKDPSKGRADFGEHAKVCVFIVDDPAIGPFVSVPGHWCAANLNHLKKDNPSRQTLRDRAAKTILRGLAHACGTGATLEPSCSLYYGTSTLKGLDETGIMISPMSYFPMLEILRAIGGDEMLSPALAEEE